MINNTWQYKKYRKWTLMAIFDRKTLSNQNEKWEICNFQSDLPKTDIKVNANDLR